MKYEDRDANMEMSRAAKARRKKLAAKRRRRKKIKRLIRNWCILGMVAAIAICVVKFMEKPVKKPSDKDNSVNNIIPVNLENIKNTETQTETQTTAEEATTEAKTTKYRLEKPEIREGDAIRERILELSQEYPEFQEIYDNIDNYPEPLMAALGNNPEMIGFVKGYLTEEPVVKGGITQEELSKDFPLFIQWDSRWGYVHYGDDTIAQSGCAPTCISMVAAALTRDVLTTPDKVAAYAEANGYYQANVGTAWSIMTEGVSEFGIRGEELSLNKNTVIRELENGNPIICSVRPGDFTASGHFIVLVGVKDGKIVINDPNSTIRSSMLWEYEDIEGQIKNLWVFYKE